MDEEAPSHGLIGRDGVCYRGPTAAPSVLAPSFVATTPSAMMTPAPPNTPSPRAAGIRGRPGAAFEAILASAPPTMPSAASPQHAASLAVQHALGEAYVLARSRILAYEQRLFQRRDSVAFLFAADAAIREMRLQYISSAGGQFWAFFDPTASSRSARRSTAGGDAPLEGVALRRPASELIASERASLSELVMEAEATYPGFAEDLYQVVYDGTVLWARDLTKDLAARGAAASRREP